MKIERRDFVKWVLAHFIAIGAGGFLSGCEGEDLKSLVPKPTREPDLSPTASPTTPAATPSPSLKTQAPTSTPTSTPTSSPTAPARAPVLSAYPDLVVVRKGEPEQLVRRALAVLGGIERFVRPGNDVIIKPNICVEQNTYEYASTTNPWVIGTLVKMCLEAGASRVRVIDAPFSGEAQVAYVRSGIQEQVIAAGGRMELMSRFKYVPVEIPQGLDLRKVDIYEDVLKADVLINVPIAKHHSLSRLTLGMKNLMGVIRDRPAIHYNIGQRLADLASRIRPVLTVIDAVRILTANGPTGGNLNDVKKLDTIIASTDIVAADSYGASLFGLQPGDLPYIRAAAAMGLGRSDLSNLRIQEVAVGG